jgi:hypothetical protein
MYSFTGTGPSFTATDGAPSPPVSLRFDYSQCAYIFDNCNGDEYTFDCNGNVQKLVKADGTIVQMGNPDMHTSITDSAGNVTTTSVLYEMVPSGPNAGKRQVGPVLPGVIAWGRESRHDLGRSNHGTADMAAGCGKAAILAGSDRRSCEERTLCDGVLPRPRSF